MKFRTYPQIVLIALASICLAICGTSTSVAGSAFDLAGGFSPTSNPNGPWAYGWKGSLGGAFTALTVPHVSTADGGESIPSWQLTSFQTPAVYKNTTAGTVTAAGGAASFPPGTVWFYAGEDGRPENFGVIRFTVPAGGAGNYEVKVSVGPSYNGPLQGDTDFHVVRNGVEVFGEALAPGAEAGYTNSMTLAAGDTLDFAIGRGADGSLYGSGLRIAASLTTDSEVPEGPSITSQPESRTVSVGSNVTFAVVAEGSAPLAFQWRHNGADIANATTAALVLENVQSADGGIYTVLVSNAVIGVESSPAALTVIVPPPPGSYDANRDFSLASNPNGVWSYGAIPQIGGSFTLLAAPHVQSAANGVEVQSWEFHLYSEPAVFCNTTTQTANAGSGTYPPGTIWFFAGYPGSGNNLGAIRFTLPAGEEGAYRVEAAVQHYLDGPPAGDTDFHVAKNGSELFGQFMSASDRSGYTNTLTLAAGDTVDFLVGRGADDQLYASGLKIAARIVRTDVTNIAPLILTQPQSQSVMAGTGVTISVAVEGTAPLSYQWRFNGLDITDANASSLTLSNVQSDDIGKYSVRVSNAFGSVTSSEVMLRVTTPPPPGTYDLSRDFSASDNPNGPWSFGWAGSVGGSFTLLTVPHTSLADGVLIPSWQLTSYQTPAIYQNTSSNTVEIAGGQGVFPPGTVWYYPGEDGRPENFGVIRFTVPANASGNYHLETSARSVYEGSLSRDTDFHVVKNGTEIFGESLPVNSGTAYTNIIALAGGDTIDFVIGRGGDQSQYASGLKIRASLSLDGAVIDLPPLIVAQPQSQTVLADSSVTFSVAAEGTAPLSYQWRFNSADIPGEIGPSLTLDHVQAANAGKYSVRVSNTAGAALSLDTTLKITTLPSPGDYDLSRDFSAVDNPGGVWSFGWSGSVGGGFNLLTVPHISSADSVLIPSWQLTSYQTPAVYQNNSASTVSIAGGQGVFPPGTIWYYPGEDGRTENFGVIRFTVPPGGAGNYRLETSVHAVYDGLLSRDTDFHVAKNGMEIFGEALAANSGTSYSNILSLSVGDTVDFIIGRGADGSQYASGLKIQATLRLDGAVIDVPPLIVGQPQGGNVLAGSSVTLSVVAEGTQPLGYQWRFNGEDITGETGASLTLENAQPGNSGGYAVRVSNPFGSTLSMTAALTVDPTNAPPIITRQPSSRQAAPGETVTFSVQLAGTAPFTYQWQFNETDIADATNAQLTLSAVVPANAGIYSVNVSSPFGLANSADAQLVVTNIVIDGTVSFGNHSADLDAPVFDVGGTTRLSGPNYRAQLYAGPTIADLAPVGPSVGFRDNGYFGGGTRNIPTVSPGQSAYVQVRVWDQLTGTNYDTALSAGGRTGASAIFSVITGNGGSPPALPTPLIGLQSFSLTQGAAASPLLAPVIRTGAPRPDGTPTWLLTGQMGATYSIECSTNLLTWVPAFNVFNPSGTVEFTDPNIGTTSCTFYRARLTE